MARGTAERQIPLGSCPRFGRKKAGWTGCSGTFTWGTRTHITPSHQTLYCLRTLICPKSCPTAGPSLGCSFVTNASPAPFTPLPHPRQLSGDTVPSFLNWVTAHREPSEPLLPYFVTRGVSQLSAPGRAGARLAPVQPSLWVCASYAVEAQRRVCYTSG